MTKAEMIARFLFSIPLATLMIGNVIALYLGYKKTDLLLEYFKNSSSTITSAVSFNPGPRSKIQLVGSACVLLTFPRFYIKHGILSAEDFDNFPCPLRRKLVALQWSVIASFAALAVLIAILKSGLLK
ncbi:hypothetical protein [Pseudomonas putida]|uniref:hypothetical protein n=1 Tax=Pseudomonas putida TaxID=303 RepID=UPI003D99D682